MGAIYLRLLGNIVRTFFAPQFLGGRRRKAVPLDMELDAAIPFDPTWLPCYLGFVRLWMGSLGWVHRRFGDRALGEMERFLVDFESLFLQSHKVFSQCDSTVRTRPGPKARLDSLMIHAFDRNSFCFPSLHVMIVRFNAGRVAAILDRLKSPGEDFLSEKVFLEERAIRIAESIVHVKQHSLSDIPAGLFFLQSLGLGGTPEEDLRFLERLFDQTGQGGRGHRIRSYLRALYHRLQEARSQGCDSHAVLVQFLRGYEGEIRALMKLCPPETRTPDYLGIPG